MLEAARRAVGTCWEAAAGCGGAATIDGACLAGAWHTDCCRARARVAASAGNAIALRVAAQSRALVQALLGRACIIHQPTENHCA